MGDELVRIERLSQIVVSPGSDGDLLIRFAPPLRQHQHRGRVAAGGGADLPQRLDPGKLGHRAIEDHEVGPLELDDLPYGRSVVQGSDDVPAGAERSPHDLDHKFIVVGDQDQSHEPAPSSGNWRICLL